MKIMKLFLVLTLYFLAARGWDSCQVSSRRLLSRQEEAEGSGGSSRRLLSRQEEAEGSGGLLPFSREISSESDEDANNMEAELLLPDDMDSEKVEDAAENKENAAKSESNESLQLENPEMEKPMIENEKKKQTMDESIVTKNEEVDFLLEESDAGEGEGHKKEESGAAGEKGQADSLAEKKSFEGEVFQDEQGETKAKKVKAERQEDSSSSVSVKALDTHTIKMELMGEELSEESGSGDKGEAGSLAQQKSPEKLINEKGQDPKVERKTKTAKIVVEQTSSSGKALDTPIDLKLQGEGVEGNSGEVSAVDVEETETKTGGALVSEDGGASRGEKKSKKKKKGMDMESTAVKDMGEEKLTSNTENGIDIELNPKDSKDSSYGDGDDANEKPSKGSQAVKKDKVKKKKDMEKKPSKETSASMGEDTAELETLAMDVTPVNVIDKEMGRSNDAKDVEEKGGGKLENEEEITDLKPSVEKQQGSSGQTNNKEKNPKGKPLKEMKTNQAESKEEVELKLTVDGQTKAKTKANRGKNEALPDSGLELVGGLDMAADEQVKAPDTAKSKEKSKKRKKKMKKEEKLVEKAKKVKDVEKQMDKGVQEGNSSDSVLSRRGKMEAAKPDIPTVNANSDDGGSITPQLDKSIAMKPSKESKDIEKEQKPEEEEDDEYGDFMQDFTDLPSKFQDTAQKVAGHLGPNIQRLTDRSKGYFNRANQQMTESFSPLVGKQFAPFFASIVSYGLLLLPLAVVVVLFEHIRALLSLQKVLLFVNIYLAAYFATLLLATFIMGEPMNFFYKSSASGYIHLQLLQALGYIIYLIMQTFDMVSSCSSETKAVKVTVVLQWLVAIMIGFHYYVTVFHRAMAKKGPHTNWKIYGVYSIAFFILCLFARITRVKKGYSQLGQVDTNKKN